ncbi:MAG: hypothetical protein AAGA48_37560 [Myxococcota bacterium]
MLGLFMASLVLSAAVAGTSLLATHSSTSAAHPLRYWTLQLAGFGIVGLPLALVGVTPWLALLLALAIGGLFARGVQPLLTDQTEDTGLDWLAGSWGRVVLPIRGRRGKVAVQTARGRIELPATTDEDRLIARGTNVFVAFVEHGRAHVVHLRSSQRPTPSLGEQNAVLRNDFTEQDGRDRPAL